MLPTHRSRRQRGFSYIGLLILVAVMGVTLAATGELWQTTRKRDKEEELLFVGNQFRNAIRHYYNQAGAVTRFPTSLADLLKDPRSPSTRRYLRKIYVDPMTGSTDWGLVKGPSGEIYGVYSRSEEEPMKRANFRVADAAFEGRKRYADWQFVYLGPTQAQPPGAQQGQQQIQQQNRQQGQPRTRPGQSLPFQLSPSPLPQPITNGNP